MVRVDLPPGEHDPTDPEGLAEREREHKRRIFVAASLQRDTLVWLLEGRKGRREVRRQLLEAGFDVFSDLVPTVFDRHYGEMCTRESFRAPGVQLIWTLMRMLATGELPRDPFVQLMTESDDE